MINIDLSMPGLSVQAMQPIHVCDPNWSWYHSAGTTLSRPFIVWLVYGGQSTLEIDGGLTYHVQHGDACLLPIESHSYIGRQNPESPLDVIWFAFSFLNDRGDMVSPKGLTDFPVKIKLSDFEACNFIMQRLAEVDEEARKHWAYCLLYEIQRQSALESGTSTDQMIREVARQVQKTPGNYRGLGDMMSEVFMSKDHFIRTFKKLLGVSPGEYLIQCRMERAMSLLSLGNISVKETAVTLGYSHQSVFSRQFKDRIGVAPRDYMHYGHSPR